MKKDRTEICNIIEDYVEQQRTEAIGWMYAYACHLLDNGTGKKEGMAEDLRNVLVPEIIKQAKKDLNV